MKAAKYQKGWEGVLTRFFIAVRLPLRWNPVRKRFVGFSGHTFIRLNPRAETGTWARMPDLIRRYEDGRIGDPSRNVIAIVASRSYGDNVEDCLVVMRLGTLVPALQALLESDRERYDDGRSTRSNR